MPKSRTSKSPAFYCQACELLFRIPSEELGTPGQVFSVACPMCGRKARVERLPDGALQIVHKEHVLICPRPLNNNPLAVAIVYLCGALVLAAAFTAVAHFTGPLLCPVVLTASILFVGVIGAIQLQSSGALSKNFVELMRIFYKGLPNLLGKSAPRGKVLPE